jgi:alcohol dehydrogenase class IV
MQTLQDLFDLGLGEDPEDLFIAVKGFVESLGLPTSLAELGLCIEDETRRALAAETMRMVLIRNNPRLTTESECRDLLHQMA